jgi:lipopolysaccharide/colanic/teichoic acid biosynthesis glycosyltransferase
MGSLRLTVRAGVPSVAWRPLRALSRVVAAGVLTVALPLAAILAIAVRLSSNGPVLHREPALDPRGRPIELLSFRTAVDGAGTVHHQRVRAVVGADFEETLTGVGRLMRATGVHRLPRLFNVAAGHSGLFGR